MARYATTGDAKAQRLQPTGEPVPDALPIDIQFAEYRDFAGEHIVLHSWRRGIRLLPVAGLSGVLQCDMTHELFRLVP